MSKSPYYVRKRFNQSGLISSLPRVSSVVEQRTVYAKVASSSLVLSAIWKIGFESLRVHKLLQFPSIYKLVTFYYLFNKKRVEFGITLKCTDTMCNKEQMFIQLKYLSKLYFLYSPVWSSGLRLRSAKALYRWFESNYRLYCFCMILLESIQRILTAIFILFYLNA